MITFHAIFARRHGEPRGYPLVASNGSEIPVREKFAELTGANPLGETFRRKNAELWMMIDFAIVEQLEFPNPANAENARRTKALTDALAAQAQLDQSRAGLAAAQAAAKQAQAAVRDLTPEQVQLVNQHRDALAQKAQPGSGGAEAARAASAAEAARVAKAGEETARQAAADADAAQVALYESARSGLAKITDAELNLAATNYRVDIAGLDRPAAIDRILTASGHKPAPPASESGGGVRRDLEMLSDADLQKVCGEYKVDSSKFSDKPALIDAILESAGYKQAPPVS